MNTATDYDEWALPPVTRCTSCGHHVNQHNGLTIDAVTHETIDGPYCVACDCREFLPRAVRVERSDCEGSFMPRAEAS